MGETMGAASTETIRVGAFGVRFLVQAADSNGSVSVFECDVPAAGRMPAPHSHDAFEETIYGLDGITSWTVDGRLSTSALATQSAFLAERSTVSTTTGARTRRSSQWPVRL